MKNTTTTSLNPFDVLGVDDSTSDADVKKAYFQMVRQFSPEKHGEQFKQVREAYDLLKDPSRRLEAEVFNLTKPTGEILVEEVEASSIQLDAEVFLSWLMQAFTDFERTDFTSDFNEVL